jgi:hypothetical protein
MVGLDLDEYRLDHSPGSSASAVSASLASGSAFMGAVADRPAGG